MINKTVNEDSPLLNTQQSLPPSYSEEMDKIIMKSVEEKVEDIISEIGFGKFQYRILALCGLGWLSDNLWLQTVNALLLPIQAQFNVDDDVIGFLPSSIFLGMMFGSLFWGVFSDIKGRKLAFNLTLIIGFISAIFAGFAPSFISLCFSLIFLGFGIGGNMPVDGAIFLEFTPVQNRYLLTSLSSFFSFASTLVGITSYLIVPKYSCPLNDKECDVNIYNPGWRYVILLFALLTAIMIILRVILFRLPESPKYLLSQGKVQEASDVLRHIINFNESKVDLDERELLQFYYDSVNEYCDLNDPELPIKSTKRQTTWLRPMGLDTKLFQDLLSPKYFTSTILIWLIWSLMALAFTIVSSFLTKFFLFKGIGSSSDSQNLEEIYLDLVKFSIYCIPGSIVGAYLADSSLGRKGSMALSTFGSAISLTIFTISDVKWVVQLSSYVFSFLTTMMYAVTYCYTPEIFETRLRGTATGVAACLGRIFCTFAPLISGYLFKISPLYSLTLSIISFVLLTICMLLLPIETRGIYV